MRKNFLFIIDPADTLNPKKDTTLALIKASQTLGHINYICQTDDFKVQKQNIQIHVRQIYLPDEYRKNPEHKMILTESVWSPATDFDVIFMRKDPPVDDAYITCTHILSLIEKMGTKIVNPPAMLRDYNEKLFAFEFPNLIPEFCLSHHKDALYDFACQHEKIILKPIDGMGGKGIFITHKDDANFAVIHETLSHNGKNAILAQKFIPDIQYGDKRILILHGKVFEYGLSRIPTGSSIRGNLAAGGRYETRPLTGRESDIAHQVAVVLREKKIDLCGIDVIGDYLTEINITSPTCFLEISDYCKTDIAMEFIMGYV